MFWKHPETQVFYGREPELRWLHDRVVSLMTDRGYRHLTPLQGPAVYPEPNFVTRYRQDVVDLIFKWRGEGRLHDIRDIPLGRAITTKDPVVKGVGQVKSGKAVVAFAPTRIPHSKLRGIQSKAQTFVVSAQAFSTIGFRPRDWTDADRAALSAEMEGRGPSQDVPAVLQWLDQHTEDELYQPLLTRITPIAEAAFTLP